MAESELLASKNIAQISIANQELSYLDSISGCRMSIKDIPTVFREEKTLLLLFPSVGLGYLYHATGNIDFLIFSILGLVSPAYNFSVTYLYNIEMPNEEGITPEKITIRSFFFWAFPVVAHLFLIGGLVKNLNHSDYFLVYLLISSIFLLMVAYFSLKYSKEFRRYKKLYGGKD